jgi:2-oxoglutarate ferredoxin oxidoreductase subunit alpha
VLYDSDHVEPKPEWQAIIITSAFPFPSLTVEAIGGTAKDKGKNIYALGLIAKMFDLNVPKLEKLIGERFGGKDPSILNNALAAFHAGYKPLARQPARRPSSSWTARKRTAIRS